jgi:hypothetical protein
MLSVVDLDPSAFFRKDYTIRNAGSISHDRGCHL